MSDTTIVSVAPYGSWSSPISAELIVSAAVSLGDVWVEGARTWWSELRPSEAGRVELVCDGADLLGPPWSARTRVHEYGGGAWWVHDAQLYFTNWADQRLYRLDDGGHEPVALTPEPALPGGWRYADGRVSPDGRWIICVREDHHPWPGGSVGPGAPGAPAGEARNEIVAIAPTGGEPMVLVSGADFVAAPRLSADGGWLCWLAWDHPNMPWDATQLWVARFADGGIRDARCVAGAAGGEALVQPEWGPDGHLYFCSDRSNWWNLYRLESDGDGGPVGFPVTLTALEVDIALPAWVFGRSRYGFSPDGTTLVFAHGGQQHQHLALLDLRDHRMQTIETGLATFEALRVRSGPEGDEVVGVGAGFAVEAAIVAIPLNGTPHRVLRPPRSLALPSGRVWDTIPSGRVWDTIPIGMVSMPEHVTFPSEHGRRAHGWFYPPANSAFRAPADERPPLVVLSHGGPTSAANPAFSLSVQYWTSRGFAVLDVDYGGSTGYGRAYRQLLEGSWGVVDVEDCCAGAQWLADAGRCDSARMVIRGGSAGGFTTLAALAFRSTFKAGASHYGVADLSALAEETHKFESRYLDGLVGPYPAARAVYEARSPIHHTEGFDCPLIVLQGSEDMIVPPAQSRAMVAALAAKSIPHAYLEFEGEQHGFRQAANIRRALEAELYFYSRVLGFELGDAVEAVAIEFAERL